MSQITLGQVKRAGYFICVWKNNIVEQESSNPKEILENLAQHGYFNKTNLSQKRNPYYFKSDD